LIAECAEGTGRQDFLEWFTAENSSDLAERLCDKYQVNGQTAWSFLRKAERFDLQIITDLPDETARAMRCSKIDPARLSDPRPGRGYILPRGARTMVT
jgi:hypothetical protein